MSNSDASDIKSRLQVTCRNCSLTALCIPRGLAPEDIERISRIVSRRKTLQRGEYLYHRGEPFRGIVAIKSGTAKTVTYDAHGNEYITGILLPGELLGFDALASNRHTCSAIALETLSFCELPADGLDELCRQVPNLLRELFRHAGARVDEDADLLVINKQPAEERIAAFLLNLSERLRKRGFSAVSFKLTLTRQEIGNYLGLALETVSRNLRNLQDRGLIAIEHRHIHITDLKGLNRICTHRE